MYLAKKRRLERIFDLKHNRTLLIPMDHGLTLGPLPGIESVAKISKFISNPNISGIVAHKGILERLLERHNLEHLALLLHVNGASSIGLGNDNKQLLASIEAGERLGVDGISLQVNFTEANDMDNLVMLGAVSDCASAAGLPLLTMLYDKAATSQNRTRRMRQLIRQCTELGSSIIKIAPPENLLDLEEILNNLSTDVSIVVAGGSMTQEADVMQTVHHAVRSGAKGICIGRNIFERRNPADMISKIKSAVEQSYEPKLTASTPFNILTMAAGDLQNV